MFFTAAHAALKTASSCPTLRDWCKHLQACVTLSIDIEPDGKQGKEEKPEPEANFALSGKLAAESNTVKGVVLVHQEPPEARKPSQMWRLYGFKNGEPFCTCH